MEFKSFPQDDAHDAEVDVTSPQDQNAHFEEGAPTSDKVTLVKQAFAAHEVGAPDPSKPTILLVDDDEGIRAEYAGIFSRAGYNVEEAEDGLAGLDRIKKVQPDIIWSGIVMPRMDGFVLVETLKQNPHLAHIPVIVCSHQGDMKDRARMQSLGVADFILHGYVSPEEVIDRVAVFVAVLEEYFIPLNINDPDVQKLIERNNPAIACPHGQRLALKVTQDHKKQLLGQIVCI